MPNLPSSAPSNRSKKRKLISNTGTKSKTFTKIKVAQKSPKKRDEPVRFTRWTSEIYQVQGQVSRLPSILRITYKYSGIEYAFFLSLQYQWYSIIHVRLKFFKNNFLCKFLFRTPENVPSIVSNTRLKQFWIFDRANTVDYERIGKNFKFFHGGNYGHNVDDLSMSHWRSCFKIINWI